MLSYWWVDKYAEIIIKILNWAFGTKLNLGWIV